VQSHNDHSKDCLYKTIFDSEGHPDVEVVLTDAICDFLGCDPCGEDCANLHLDRHFDLVGANKTLTFYDAGCATFRFPFGDYKVQICTCGTVWIFGDEQAHREGTLQLPASMKWDTRMEAGQSESRMEAGE
jgi:hypothetical protein